MKPSISEIQKKQKLIRREILSSMSKYDDIEDIMNDLNKKVGRREFFGWAALTTLSLYNGFNMFNNNKESKNIKNIYGLGEHVHMADYIGTSENKEIKSRGAGIFFDDYYISMAHMTNNFRKQRIMTPFGMYEKDIKTENITQKVGDTNIETLVNSITLKGVGTDVYIGKPDKKVVNFPCKPNRNVELGDEIYIIGNPGLSGTNIRKGYVSDLNGWGEKDESLMGNREYVFGIDFPLMGGDSGTPVVNNNFELVGLAKYEVANKFGYVNKIGLYIDEIDKIKNLHKTLEKYIVPEGA